MIDSAAPRARGRRRPSWSRTQGRSLAGGKARPEDEDPAKGFAVIRVRGVGGSVIWIEEMAQEALPRLREHRLWMELHSLGRKLAVANPHHHLPRGRRPLEPVRQLRIDDERV